MMLVPFYSPSYRRQIGLFQQAHPPALDTFAGRRQVYVVVLVQLSLFSTHSVCMPVLSSRNFGLPGPTK